MSIRLSCVGVLVSVALSGCVVGADVVEEPSGIETSMSPGRPETSGKTGTSPTEAPTVNGIRVAISSHCGVSSAWVTGELWLASPPLGGHNPPQGWGENETLGSFVVTADRRAVFYGDGDQRARFRLAESGAVDPNEGCE